MKNIVFSLSIISAMFIVSCEKAIVVYPGNTQELEPKPPKGDIAWVIDNIDGKGQLEEHTAISVTVGTLNATDPNPDDEFSYVLTNFNQYFQLITADGITNLEIKSDINYESDQIPSSKQFDLVVRVTDDGIEPQATDFSIPIQITNKNETPYYTNINSIVNYADEHIEYNFDKVEWSDTDDGDNPSLTSSGPSWLDISPEGQMAGTPTTSDIGNNSYVLTISDGEFEVQEEVVIEVRENTAPLFNDTGSIPTSIRVGCWDDQDDLVYLSWYDPNNSMPYFGGQDLVTFNVEEDISWMNWNDDGYLFCVTAPVNSDAGSSVVSLTITDNRPNSQKSTEYEFNLSVVANDAPGFVNLNSFPDTMNESDTLNFDLDWVDPNEDQTTFNLLIDNFSADQLSWFNIDQSGNITVIPGSSHNGEYDLKFSVSDGCYTTEEQKTFTVQNNY